jgi:hypothetical protein
MFNTNGLQRPSTRTHLLTTSDKHLALKKMLSFFQPGPLFLPPFIVYIGDSPTDLSPLLQADIGIIMCPPSSNRGALGTLINKCGYRVLPVSEYKGLYSKEKGEDESILLSANNFMEIMESGMFHDQEWDPRNTKKAQNKTGPKG